jgi:tRNA-dihydrouridine synthase B
MKTLKIGDVKIKNRLFLAPMVDVTDLPYRLICRKAGVGIAYTEMLYLDAITHENNKTKKLMETCKKDTPIGIQITGSDPKELDKVISMKVFDNYDIVDLNCGCPSVKITGNEAGSYLLNNPEKVVEMIKKIKNEGHLTTAKIRLGYKDNKVVEIAKMIEKAGADAITVHARLAIQSGKIPADWNQIKKVKKELGIPVIGNGDIFSGKNASDMLEIADGAMIARGAIGDPYIFDRILHYLKTGKEKEFDLKKNIKSFFEYIKLCKKYGFEEVGRIKYIGSNFIREFEGAARLRSDLMKLKSFSEIEGFIKKL